MTNKFRVIQPLPVEGAEPTARPVQMSLDGGYRGDVSPRSVPLDSTPELSDVRFERKALRKDFGWTAIGTAATDTVLGLLEHKYIDAEQTFHRLIRIWRNGSNQAELEVWDGANWVATDTSTETIDPVYLSGLSALGCAYFADGQQVLEWCEVLQKIPQENDFPNGNLMTAALEQIDATINPGDAAVLDYTVTYRVTVNSSPGQDTTIVLEFLDGSTVLGEVTHIVSQFETFPFTLTGQQFQFTRQVSLNDIISIRVKSAEGGGTTFELDNAISAGPGGPGAPDLIGNKTPPGQPAVDDNYQWNFVLGGVVGTVTVGFYTQIDGGGWNQRATQDYNGSGGESFIINIPNLVGTTVEFGTAVEAGTGGIGDIQVGWTRSKADFGVHGHNTAQGDSPAGVTYETTGAVVSQFEAIDPGPGGRFLAFFARRLVVLRNFGDTQALTWSADGILNDFISEGSGEIILVEARSDPVDDLMGTAVLSSNFMALFRKRSIMRVFETGNVALALGAVSWIENLGTNAPFSVRNVLGGAMFLGHDFMVYFLTENGPQPVGKPIQQDLIETLTDNLDLIDSGWDPAFGEYYLGVAENGGTEIDKVWIFDVNKFLQEQRVVWRTRPMTIQRFAVASEVE